jgi:hypothetical protein
LAVKNETREGPRRPPPPPSTQRAEEEETSPLKGVEAIREQLQVGLQALDEADDLLDEMEWTSANRNTPSVTGKHKRSRSRRRGY